MQTQETAMRTVLFKLTKAVTSFYVRHHSPWKSREGGLQRYCMWDGLRVAKGWD